MPAVDLNDCGAACNSGTAAPLLFAVWAEPEESLEVLRAIGAVAVARSIGERGGGEGKWEDGGMLRSRPMSGGGGKGCGVIESVETDVG